MSGAVRPVALLGALLILAGLVLVAASPATPPAAAALGGLTAFQIDGDTAGPNDWDDPPPTLTDFATTTDECGNGVLDSDQLDGKLDALDLDNPNPTPGDVVSKGDLCQVWRALEPVAVGSGFDVVLYGAWERFSGNGEVTGYWPLLGPAPGKSDDYLIEFAYESQGGSAIYVRTWSGSSWVRAGSLPPSVFDVALDNDSRPLFGEFAINLTEAGLWDGAEDPCTSYASDFVFSQTGNSQQAELQDYVGLSPVPISQCGRLTVTKVTTPEAPDPAVSFDYLVERTSGDDVQPGESSVTGSLVVPDEPADIIDPVLGGSDYTVSETDLPTGWTRESTICTAVNPSTGATVDYDLDEVDSFPIKPGTDGECVISNVAPATLQIAKETSPAGLTGFEFDTAVNGSAGPSATLDDGESFDVPITAGDEVVVTEALATGGVVLEAIDCVGTDSFTPDLTGGSVTVTPGPGEQVVCTFLNVAPPAPTEALIVVQKVVADPDGTGFGFTVTGAGATPDEFTLTPPDEAVQVVTVVPDEVGSDYLITEDLPEGWLLDDVVCVAPDQTPGAEGSVSVTVAPGDVAFCRFENSPVPPSARLTVVKETNPGGGTGFPFTIKRGVEPAEFTLDDGEFISFDDIDPGRYTVTEEVPEGWLAEGECRDQDEQVIAEVDDGRVKVALADGDDVTCRFLNVEQVSLTLTKVAVPQSPQLFDFDVAFAKLAPVRIQLDDDGDATDEPENGLFPNTITGPSLTPGVYTLSEVGVDGWTLDDLTCTGDGVIDADPATGVAIVDLAPGEAAACTYTNVQDEVPPTPTPTPTPTTPTEPTPTPTDGGVLGGGEGLGDTGAGSLGAALLAGLGLLVVGALLLLAGQIIRRPV